MRVTIRTAAHLATTDVADAVQIIGGCSIRPGTGIWFDWAGHTVVEASQDIILVGQADRVLPCTERLISMCLEHEDAVLVEFESKDLGFAYKFFVDI